MIRSERSEILSPDLEKKLLPHKADLKPIPQTWTFGQSEFRNGTFDEQSIETQLGIAKEIVRQANSIDYYPTPESEARLSGDCMTTAVALIDYAKKLQIPGTFQLASVLKNPFDGDWRKSTRHIIAVHRDEKEHFRTIDPATMVGYGYGTIGSPATMTESGKLVPVEHNQELVYEDIAFLSPDDLTLIRSINKIRHGFYTGQQYSPERTDLFIRQVEKNLAAKEHVHLNSWLSELHYIQAMALLEKGDKDGFKRHIKRSVLLDPLKPKILDEPGTPTEVSDIVRRAFDHYKSTAQDVANTWLWQAREIFRRNDPEEYKEGVRLLQWAFREKKGAQLISDPIPTIPINGIPVPIYNINPRLLAESGLTVAWIKPSAALMGMEEKAREALGSTGKVVWEETANLAKKDALLQGALPLILAHPHGAFDNNRSSYWGTTTILLIKATPEALSAVKREFRAATKPEANAEGLVRTADGSLISWEPGTMNFIHTCDTAAESVAHLLLTRPDLCLTNRWDYPHPNL